MKVYPYKIFDSNLKSYLTKVQIDVPVVLDYFSEIFFNCTNEELLKSFPDNDMNRVCIYEFEKKWRSHGKHSILVVDGRGLIGSYFIIYGRSEFCDLIKKLEEGDKEFQKKKLLQLVKTRDEDYYKNLNYR